MMLAMTFRDRLRQEYARRRAANARYSLRAMAKLLGADHASLSQIMRGKRPVPVERIGPWARKLKLSSEEVAVYSAVARVVDAQVQAAQEALRHWSTEVLSLLSMPVHQEILRLSRTATFKSESRWIAAQTGSNVDDVNIALSRMLRLGLLEADAKGIWRDRTGLREITSAGFRKFIAERLPNPLQHKGE